MEFGYWIVAWIPKDMGEVRLRRALVEANSAEDAVALLLHSLGDPMREWHTVYPAVKQESNLRRGKVIAKDMDLDYVKR